MSKLPLLGLVLLVSTGCAAKYQTVRTVAASSLLDPGKSVLVTTPEDGNYEHIEYPGSGASTSRAVVSAFSRYATQVDREADISDCSEGLEAAKERGYVYLGCPTILRWEDRATEWSGRRDKIEVSLRVYDVATGEVLDSVVISGRSKWATFGGDHPQDLLTDPIVSHVGSLY